MLRAEPGRPGLPKPSTHTDRGQATASRSPATTAGAPENSTLLPKMGTKTVRDGQRRVVSPQGARLNLWVYKGYCSGIAPHPI